MSELDERPSAAGLVYRASGTGTGDRAWARSLVVRHAALHRLRLVTVYELDDDRARNGDVLARLRDLALRADLEVLVVDGLDDDLAAALARDLDLRLEGIRRPPA